MNQKFIMNDRTWEIIEASQKTILVWAELESEAGMKLHGLCVPAKQTILIWDLQCEEQKIQTLKHELLHAYIHSFAFSQESYSEDDLCELYANASDIINDIVKRYKEREEIKNESI